MFHLLRSKTQERMSAVDEAWLRMDQSTNPMVINGVMIFDTPVEYHRMQSILEERLVAEYRRFRQHVTEEPARSGRLYWEDDPHFDVRSHIVRIALPKPGDAATLQELVGELMNVSLDLRRPLWRFYLIEDYGPGCVIFCRIHHCIADGMALVRVLLSLTDQHAADRVGRNAAKARPLGKAIASVGRMWNDVTSITGSAASAGVRMWEDPAQLAEFAMSTATVSATSAAILARFAVLTSERGSTYRGELGGVKRVAWSEPLDLNLVKQVCRATDSTVNDVLVTAVAGALRQDILRRQPAAIELDLRAMVPINLRAANDDGSLGNRFSLIYLSLPVEVASLEERLATVKKRMQHVKNSPEVFLVYQILNSLGRLPMGLTQRAVRWFSDKATCVLTNVPGPREPLTFGDAVLERLIFWVPQSGQLGLGISIVSYNGTVTLGVMTDSHLIPDPGAIVRGYSDEFKQLVALVQAPASTSAESTGLDVQASQPE